MRKTLFALVVALVCAFAVGSEAQQPPAATLAITLRAEPRARLRVSELSSFALQAVVRNTGSATIDPHLGDSVLLVNGRPWEGWSLTINNGPIDGRWSALPPGDSLQFGRALQDALFAGGPGRYEIVLQSSGVRSPALVVTVTP